MITTPEVSGEPGQAPFAATTGGTAERSQVARMPIGVQDWNGLGRASVVPGQQVGAGRLTGGRPSPVSLTLVVPSRPRPIASLLHS